MGDIKPKPGKGVYVHSLFPSEMQDNLHFFAKALRSPVDVITADDGIGQVSFDTLPTVGVTPNSINE